MKKVLKKILIATVAAGSWIFTPPVGNLNFIPTANGSRRIDLERTFK